MAMMIGIDERGRAMPLTGGRGGSHPTVIDLIGESSSSRFGPAGGGGGGGFARARKRQASSDATIDLTGDDEENDDDEVIEILDDWSSQGRGGGGGGGGGGRRRGMAYGGQHHHQHQHVKRKAPALPASAIRRPAPIEELDLTGLKDGDYDNISRKRPPPSPIPAVAAVGGGAGRPSSIPMNGGGGGGAAVGEGFVFGLDDAQGGGKGTPIREVEGNEEAAVKEVLDVLADCDENHIRLMLGRLGSADQVINHLLNNADYPRLKAGGEDDDIELIQVTGGGGGKGRGSSSMAGGADLPPMMTQEKMAKHVALVRKAEKYKEAKNLPEPGFHYSELAVYYLGQAFPTLSLKNVREVLTKEKFFFKAKEHIKHLLYADLLKPDEERIKMTTAQVDAAVALNIKKAGWKANNKPRTPNKKEAAGSSNAPQVHDADFEKELTFSREHDQMEQEQVHDADFEKELAFSREYDQMEQEQMDRALAEKRMTEAAEAAGTLIQCGCCFCDFSFETMTQCSEGHLFCSSCLKNYAQVRLFEEQRTCLPCMTSATADACHGFFTDNQLVRVLEPKVFSKYQEAQAAEAVRAAHLDNLVQCPYCEFQAEVDAAIQTFRCPQCCHKTCRACGGDDHPGICCDQVEKKSDTDRRRKVEEAMTAAKVRTCPKANCRKTFLKEPGTCNKVPCTACGTLTCYVCRVEIPKNVGYKHFCQTPHCRHEKCKMCPLWTNAEEDDIRAVKEAGLKANEEAAKDAQARAAAGGGASSSNDNNGGGKADPNEVGRDVDVDALLRAGMPPMGAGGRGLPTGVRVAVPAAAAAAPPPQHGGPPGGAGILARMVAIARGPAAVFGGGGPLPAAPIPAFQQAAFNMGHPPPPPQPPQGRQPQARQRQRHRRQR